MTARITTHTLKGGKLKPKPARMAVFKKIGQKAKADRLEKAWKAKIK